jgi:hypothetical protein
VRPAENSSALQVEVQAATSENASFSTVQTVPVTSANGTFVVQLPRAGKVWRLRWNGMSSRVAEVAAK